MSTAYRFNFYLILFLFGTLTLCGAQAPATPKKENNKDGAKAAKAATVISARTDGTGQHPGTAAVSGATTITCTSATSDIPNPQPPPSCFIVAPGFSGNLNRGQSAGTSGAGTVTLNCNGQGNILTCSTSLG